MWMAHRTGDAGVIASTARIVVIADAVFTASAAIVQPLTGVALAGVMGFPLLAPWIVCSFAFYLFVGACWWPVFWIQIKLRDLAAAARDARQPLPPQYRRL